MLLDNCQIFAYALIIYIYIYIYIFYNSAGVKKKPYDKFENKKEFRKLLSREKFPKKREG